MKIQLKQFGKDHWSTFAYVETCCVDYKGKLDNRRLRINDTKRPIRNPYSTLGWQPTWGTRLKDHSIPDTNHDDIDCLDDLESAGLIESIGTLLNPVYQLTEMGMKVAHQLREFKVGGGNFIDFTPILGEA